MNHLPDTLIKINPSLAKDMTPVDHARFLAAENHFKGRTWFWLWIPHLEWTYISDKHQIKCLKTTNGQPLELNGIGLEYMELKYIEAKEYQRPLFWSFNYKRYQGDQQC